MLDGGTSIEITSLEVTWVVEDDWKRLHHRLRGIAQRRIALEAEEVGLLVEAEEAALHRRLGYATILEYMERELGWGPHAAMERLRVAHELLELPLLHDEFAAGRRCFSVVRELTRVATAETEDAWLTKTEGQTTRQVERLVRGRKKGDTPEDAPDPELVRERLFFEVDGATSAELRLARVELEQEIGRAVTDAEFLGALVRRAREPAAEGMTPPAVQVAMMNSDGRRNASSEREE